MKIYLGAVQALRKKERQGEIHEPLWFSEFHPRLNANVLFRRILLNLTLCMTKLRVLCCLFLTLRISWPLPEAAILGKVLDIKLWGFQAPPGGCYFGKGCGYRGFGTFG